MRDGKNGVPPRLSRAAARFAEWRRARVVGARIPASLWASAVKLATVYGVCRTAAVLRLDYYGLKRRVEAKASIAAPEAASGQPPAFVEWPVSVLGSGGECVIELENAAGAKMRVQLKGMHAPDLLALSDSFWNTRQ